MRMLKRTFVRECRFLSALTVVSLKADLLEQLFVRCDDKRGQYTIRLYNMGRWEDGMSLFLPKNSFFVHPHD